MDLKLILQLFFDMSVPRRMMRVSDDVARMRCLLDAFMVRNMGCDLVVNSLLSDVKKRTPSLLIEK